MKNAVLDVYPEGRGTYRGVVQEDPDKNNLVWVICLATGERSLEAAEDCGEPIIKNIFTFGE